MSMKLRNPEAEFLKRIFVITLTLSAVLLTGYVIHKDQTSAFIYQIVIANDECGENNWTWEPVDCERVSLSECQTYRCGT